MTDISPDTLRRDLAEAIKKIDSDLAKLLAAYEALGGKPETLGLALGRPQPVNPDALRAALLARIVDALAQELRSGGKRRVGDLQERLREAHDLELHQNDIEHALRSDPRFARGDRGWWTFRPRGHDRNGGGSL